MRIVSWNLAHQTHELPIPEGFHVAVEKLAPDVLILNEYVHGETRVPMLERLRNQGLSQVAVSRKWGKHNQVLIASNKSLESGNLSGPVVNDAARSNFLHVRVSSYPLEIVGVRVPTYKLKAERISYWEALSNLVVPTKDRPILYIGDLNADPANPKSVGGRMLARFKEQGWTMPLPDGSWSYISSKGLKARIDHAFAGPRVQCSNARYVTELPEVTLAAANKPRVSDHAALVLDVKVLP